jgi:methylmalonyl-CoA/ethylmalonyl-CoA epimerase
MEPNMSGNTSLSLHHVGIVVANIEERRGFYVDLLGYRERTAVIHDPLQTAYVQFFSIPGSDHYLELVAPDGENSKLLNASRKGIPLNHLCYACDEIAATFDALWNAGCYRISAPTPAVAFDGRPVAWLISPDKLLIELVERGEPGSL